MKSKHEEQGLHLSVNLNFLCAIVLQKEFERLCITNDEEFKKTVIPLLYNYYFNRKDNNYLFMEDFDKYCIKLGIKEEVVVTSELLNAFAVHWFNEFKHTKEFQEEHEKLSETYYISQRIKELEECDSAVYCIETDELVKSVKMGSHFMVIKEFIDKKFGDGASDEENRYNEFDEWITTNIRITGCFSSPDFYKFKWFS